MIVVVGKERGTLGQQAQDARSEEAELVRGCIAGDKSAQETFYRRYRRPVAANVYRVLGDQNELDDLVQEVFVIAFRALDRFRGEARLSTWLYRISVNVALGRIRSRSRKPPPIPVADPEAHGGSPQADLRTPEKALLQNEERARVHRILQSLSPKKRIVLQLHEIEGLELKEIAYIVDANPVTVRTRLFYARREFYRRVAEEGM